MGKKDKTEREETSAQDNAEERSMIAITRALADPTRLSVFRRIANKENSTCMDLRGCLEMNPATLSHHMRQLESAGLIETHRDGKFVRAEVRRKVWKNYLSYLKELA
ncbi:ArsR/SmtB family transcription factor [Terriglobus sp. RCC_193]|uniref:ArsR/SmtB family transcription factor n=1 Tax=Terriglobus sp. RCC_193 TaxID=3239218 RepID=UPI0035266747